MATRSASWHRTARQFALPTALFSGFAFLLVQAVAWAQESAPSGGGTAAALGSMEYVYWGICLVGSIIDW
jgi:hypothetical protein